MFKDVVLWRMRHPDHGEWVCRLRKRTIRLLFNGDVLARVHARYLDDALTMWPRCLAQHGFVTFEPEDQPCR